MKFDEFAEKIAETIKEYLNEENVVIEKVKKNNGLVLTGLVVRAKDSVAVPTIYLEHYYEEYNNGCNFDVIVEDIIHIYEERSGISMDISFFANYEEMRDKIMFKIVHYERNALLLQEVPHIKWEDLAIVFFCILTHEQMGTGTILIRNEHMHEWGISVDDLYKAAMTNTREQMEEELFPMGAMLQKIADGADEEDKRLVEQIDESLSIYVLTNKWKMYGAGTLLYSNKMRELANELGGDIYIIPSSIHELILIPCRGVENIQYMKEMIWEVNRTQVPPEEVLSDNLYYYDKETDKIALVC